MACSCYDRFRKESNINSKRKKFVYLITEQTKTKRDVLENNLINLFKKRFGNKNTNLETFGGKRNFILFLRSIKFLPDKPFSLLQNRRHRENIISTIIDIDPTPNGFYIKWIFEVYVRYATHMAHEFIDNKESYKDILSRYAQLCKSQERVINLLRENDLFREKAAEIIEKIDFNNLNTAAGKIRDIFNFKNFGEIEELLQAAYSAHTFSTPKYDAFAKYIKSRSDADLVYYDQYYTVYVPHNKHASYEIHKMFYKLHNLSEEEVEKRTYTWCTAIKPENSHFSDYSKYGPVYFVFISAATSKSQLNSKFHKFAISLSAPTRTLGCSDSDFFRPTAEIQNARNQTVSTEEDMLMFWNQMKNVDIAISNHFLSSRAGSKAQKFLWEKLRIRKAEEYRNIIMRDVPDLKIPLIYLLARISCCDSFSRVDSSPHAVLFDKIQKLRDIKQRIGLSATDKNIGKIQVFYFEQSRGDTNIFVSPFQNQSKIFDALSVAKISIKSPVRIDVVVEDVTISEADKASMEVTAVLFRNCTIKVGVFRSCWFENCTIDGNVIIDSDSNYENSIILESKINKGSFNSCFFIGCEIGDKAILNESALLYNNKISDGAIINANNSNTISSNCMFIFPIVIYETLKAYLSGKDSVNLDRVNFSNVIKSAPGSEKILFSFYTSVPVELKYMPAVFLILGSVQVLGKKHITGVGIDVYSQEEKNSGFQVYKYNQPLDGKGLVNLVKDLIKINKHYNKNYYILFLVYVATKMKIGYSVQRMVIEAILEELKEFVGDINNLETSIVSHVVDELLSMPKFKLLNNERRHAVRSFINIGHHGTSSKEDTDYALKIIHKLSSLNK